MTAAVKRAASVQREDQMPVVCKYQKIAPKAARVAHVAVLTRRHSNRQMRAATDFRESWIRESVMALSSRSKGRDLEFGFARQPGFQNQQTECR